MDELFLEGLEIAARVGCTAPERAIPQSLRVDVRLFCPTIAQAGAADDLAMSVDYRIADRMVAAVQGQEYLLIERVAEALAQVALDEPLVQRVELTLKKRPPVQSLEWAGVRITREKRAA
jgi:dihydroneopterin aldolase